MPGRPRFLVFGRGLTMSLEGGLEELPEFFRAAANSASNAASLASRRVTFSRNVAQLGHSCGWEDFAMVTKSYTQVSG